MARYLFAIMLMALAAQFCSCARRGVDVYQNPLPVLLADPAVLRTESGDFLYYLAGTGAARYASNDLVHWTRLDDWIRFRGTGIRGDIWAAEAHEHGGKFHYFFSAHKEPSDGRRRLYRAVADRVDDDFTVISEPLWEDDYTWIDPHLHVDADGVPWLFVTNDSKDRFGGKARLYVVEMEPDLSAPKGEFVYLMEPSQPWESQWQEGASVIRRGDVYYMTWSSQLYASDNYSVGYATAPHPTGPWTKAPENPILSRRVESPADIGHSGPGHNSFATSPDGRDLYIVYHTRRNSPGGGARHVCIDKVEFLESPDGHARMTIPGAPSSAPRPLPSGATPVQRALGDEFEGEALDLSRWPAIHGHDPRWISVRDGALHLIALPGDVHRTQTGGANILLQYPPDTDNWTITTRLRFGPERNYEQAFLTVWRDANNYIMLKNVHAGGPRFESAMELHEDYTGHLEVNDIGEISWMRIRRADGAMYSCEVSADGSIWRQIGPTREFPHGHVMVGLGATRAGSPRNLVVASFDFFRVE